MAHRTVVRGKWVLAAESDDLRLLRDHSVVVEGELIAAVVKGDSGRADRVIEVPHGLVLPGFVNLHTHCSNGPLFRGIIDDVSREGWGGTAIYSLLMPVGDLAAQHLSRAELRSVVELGLLELLRCGSTTVLDMWRLEREVFFEAAREVGIRAYGSPYLFSHRKVGVAKDGRPTYERSGDADGGLGRAVELFRRHDEGPRGRRRVVLGPHGVDTCDPDLLQAVGKTAGDLGTLVTTHLSQSRPEVEEIGRRFGKSPVQHLGDLGLLGPSLVAAHCVYTSDEDLDLLRDTQTPVANCPLVFARGGHPAPFHRFASRGVVTGIGSDSYCFDFVSELRAAGIVSKLYARQSHVATAWDLVRAATLTGARALGREDLGRITPGARADLLVVDLGRPHLRPVRDPIKNLIWNATGGDVSTVMVDGEVLVHEGRFLKADEAAIAEGAARAVERVWGLAEDAGLLPRA